MVEWIIDEPLIARDRKHVWHPFTQECTAPPPIAIDHADGAYLYDTDGKAYLDLISSWWVNMHGHAHPAIAKAIYEQAQKLEHVIFAGFTHAPAIELCERLCTLLPPALSKCFFSDNGSTAVEVALKMAYQYWANQGAEERSLFLSFSGGYHGDTFGAMSVGAASVFHSPFQKLFFKTITIPYPDTWEGDNTITSKEDSALTQLEHQLTTKGHQIAALIIEPLVQGASGMRICRPAFMQKVVAMCQRAGVLVIFDEVMTGFGRLGALFALDLLGVVPDFLCLSKGLTGGFLPLALTVTQPEIYEGFLSPQAGNAFLHGHSYTANPIACRAALASLDLLIDPSCEARRAEISRAHVQGGTLLKAKCPRIQRYRHLGTINSFSLPFSDETLATFRQDALDAGLLLRPLGQELYLLPPYCVDETTLLTAYETLAKLCSHHGA